MGQQLQLKRLDFLLTKTLASCYLPPRLEFHLVVASFYYSAFIIFILLFGNSDFFPPLTICAYSRDRNQRLPCDVMRGSCPRNPPPSNDTLVAV